MHDGTADRGKTVPLSGERERLLAAPTLLAGGTSRRIRENVGWALCYNGVAVPVTAAGLLNPLVAAVAMATSSLLVVGNASRSLLGD